MATRTGRGRTHRRPFLLRRSQEKAVESVKQRTRLSPSLSLPCISGFRQISRPAAQRSPLVTSKTELDNCSRDLHRAVPHQMQIAERGGLPLGLVLCNISLGRMAT